MADVLLLPFRSDQNGVEHLARDLEGILSSGVPSGPRWAQMSACGLGLQRRCDELRWKIDEMKSELASSPEGEAFWANLNALVDAFSRLATAAQSFRKVAKKQANAGNGEVSHVY